MLNSLRTISRLPRDSRDALFMLGLIAWTLSPLLAHLPWAVLLLGGFLLAWKTQLILGQRPLPGWPLMSLLLLTCILVAWGSHKTLLGRDAGVSLIAMLLTLKTLELKARRDAWAVFFLAFFTILTNFFYSQSLLTAAAMLIACWGWMTALMLAHRPVGRPSIAQVAFLAGRMCLIGAPIMLALFMLFPRLAPFWGHPGDGISKTGLSGQMQIGQVAQLALDDSVAFRVRWLQSGETQASQAATMPHRADLYFRGPVLTLFDGQRWLTSPRKNDPRSAAIVSVSGNAWPYEITLEPHRENWLLALDGTQQQPAVPGYSTQQKPDMQWVVDRPVTQAISYQARSHMEYKYEYTAQAPRQWETIDLPPGLNPRTLAWAMEIRRMPAYRDASAREMIEMVLTHLRKGGFVYTLNPGQYGTHTADEFWFDRKLGFCEHFASSFVILMRALDIPARVVTGYQGGEVNPLDGLWTVRQSDAHAWAEVWDKQAGWVRVDPTAAAAPARFSQFQRLQAAPGPVAAALAASIGQLPVQWMQGIRSAWEAVNSRWNHYVINYTQGQQLDLLRKLGVASPSWQDLLQALGGLLAGAALLAMLLLRMSKKRGDPWVELLDKFRHKLGQLGLPCSHSHTPREIAQMMQAHWGDAAKQGTQWLLRYESARYANSSSPESLANLRSSFSGLVWPASKH